MNQIPVLFENDFCLVVNKPAGLSVQGGEGVKTSLDSLLAQAYPERPLLVHRLDKETSGIILVAKTQSAAREFSALFTGRAVLKRYQGICKGAPDPKQAAIRLDIEVWEKGKKLLKKSETFYKLLSAGTVDGVSCSLLELELGSGRTHQIRRHLAGLGHPLLADDKYGDFPLNRALKKAVKLKHLLLYASYLCIPPLPPFLDQGLELEAPPPDHFSCFVNSGV